MNTNHDMIADALGATHEPVVGDGMAQFVSRHHRPQPVRVDRTTIEQFYHQCRANGIDDPNAFLKGVLRDMLDYFTSNKQQAAEYLQTVLTDPDMTPEKAKQLAQQIVGGA